MRILSLFITVFLLTTWTSLRGAGLVPVDEFESIIRSHSRYDTIGLVHRGTYENQINQWDRELRLTGDRSFGGFHTLLTRNLIDNEEFMAAEYLKGAMRKDLWKNIVGESVDLGFKIVGIAGAAYGHTWLTTTTKSCSPCFMSEGIDASTLACTSCYQNVMLSNAGSLAAGAAIIGAGGSVLKSLWRLALVDIPEACSERAKEGLRPTAEQQTREAERVSLYLTLFLHDQISRSRDFTGNYGDYLTEAKVMQYNGIVMDILRRNFIRGSDTSLVRTVFDNKVSFIP